MKMDKPTQTLNNCHGFFILKKVPNDLGTLIYNR